MPSPNLTFKLQVMVIPTSLYIPLLYYREAKTIVPFFSFGDCSKQIFQSAAQMKIRLYYGSSVFHKIGKFNALINESCYALIQGLMLFKPEKLSS